MSNNKASNIPPRIPSSSISIARELGILFGFLLASLVIMAVYAVVWWAVDRREEERGKVRRAQLIARGVHHGRGGLHEKMLDQEGFMARVELPVHERRELGDGRSSEREMGGVREVEVSRSMGRS